MDSRRRPNQRLVWDVIDGVRGYVFIDTRRMRWRAKTSHVGVVVVLGVSQLGDTGLLVEDEVVDAMFFEGAPWINKLRSMADAAEEARENAGENVD